MGSVEDAIKSMVRNLEEKTGKPLAHWVDVAKKSGGAKHAQIVKYLKDKHDLGHGYANMIAHSALESSAMHADGDDLVSSQYSGAKGALRPIYDAILKKVATFGELEVSPKKTYVSLRRKKQFAIVQPSTATRLDVGLNLKGHPPTDRLEPSGSFNSMVSHRVRLESVKEVDAELAAWLKKAYEDA